MRCLLRPLHTQVGTQVCGSGFMVLILVFTLWCDLAGNSLGTAVANVVLLAALGQKEQRSAADFTVLRLLEDWHYQSVVRQLLKEYVQPGLRAYITTFADDIRSGTLKSSLRAIHHI